MDVTQSLVPIFIETVVPKQIKQIGTGVFLIFNSEHFLFTAAHVTDDLKNGKLLVPTVYGLTEIEGYIAHLDIPPEFSRNDDTIDMAYYRLRTEFSRLLCTQFTPLKNQIQIMETSLNLGVLSVVGYPVSKAKKKGNVYSSELAFYRGVAGEESLYTKHNFLTDQNLIINFHNKRAVSPENGLRVNPPSPRGVSGGAIFAWPYGYELSQDWSVPKLVGILHSYKEKEGLFIGTTLLPYMVATSLGRMKGYD